MVLHVSFRTIHGLPQHADLSGPNTLRTFLCQCFSSTNQFTRESPSTSSGTSLWMMSLYFCPATRTIWSWQSRACFRIYVVLLEGTGFSSPFMYPEQRTECHLRVLIGNSFERAKLHPAFPECVWKLIVAVDGTC